MICRDCKHDLQGGFQQADGSFLCARCVIVQVERAVDQEWNEKIIQECTRILAIKNRRPTKAGVREIQNLAFAIKRNRP